MSRAYTTDGKWYFNDSYASTLANAVLAIALNTSTTSNIRTFMESDVTSSNQTWGGTNQADIRITNSPSTVTSQDALEWQKAVADGVTTGEATSPARATLVMDVWYPSWVSNTTTFYGDTYEIPLFVRAPAVSKWIDNGIFSSTSTSYGFLNGVMGDVSDTEDGTTDATIEEVFTGEDLYGAFWTDDNTLVVQVTGVYTTGFYSLAFPQFGEVFYASDATVTNPTVGGVPTYTRWTWSGVTTNVFGTVSGNNILIELSTPPIESIGISSGPISLSDLQNFFGGSNPINLSEYYRSSGVGYVPDITENSGIPTSGTISLGDFYDSYK